MAWSRLPARRRRSSRRCMMRRSKALHDPGVQASLGKLGVDIVGDTPQEFHAYIKSEIPKWTAIVKASGATMDK